MSSTNSKTRQIAVEIFSSLMKGPRTQADIEEMVGCNEGTVRAWLKNLHGAGLVQIVRYCPHVYVFQSPFANPDAPLKRIRRRKVA